MKEYNFNLRTACPNDCENGVIPTGEYHFKSCWSYSPYYRIGTDFQILRVCNYCRENGNQEFQPLELEK